MGGQPLVLFFVPNANPTPYPLFSCVALVMPFPQDTILELSSTLVRFSGAKSLRDSLVSDLLGEWAASSPLARARWSEATDVGYPSLIRTKQLEAVKQYSSFLFSAPDFIGPLMDLNVTRTGFRHLSEFMTRRGIDYTAATGHTFPRPIRARQAFLDTWKDMAKPLELQPPANVDDSLASGRSWPVHSWARYIQLRPPLVDTIDWDRRLRFIVRRDAYPCTGWSWTQLSIGLLSHGKRGRTEDGRVRRQRHGRFGHYLGREASVTWRFFCPIEFKLASFQSSPFKSDKLLKI